MAPDKLIYLLYGMVIMFHVLMAWHFVFRRFTRARVCISILMLTIALKYFKDLFFLDTFYTPGLPLNRVLSSFDMLVFPFYIYVLIELMQPQWLNISKAIIVGMPFVLCEILYLITDIKVIYYIMASLSAIYAVSSTVWVLIRLPHYKFKVKNEYSDEASLDTYSLLTLMGLFVGLLSLWFYNLFFPRFLTDSIYMVLSVLSFVVAYYALEHYDKILSGLYDTGYADADYLCGLTSEEALREADMERESKAHNLSVDESFSPSLENGDDSDFQETSMEKTDSTVSSVAHPVSPFNDDLCQRLLKLFNDDHIFLDSNLRLSTLAQRLGTNRTYVSQCLNSYCGKSFYDFVNTYRIEYSKTLLNKNDYTFEVIASKSGFNSLSTFRRAFYQACGCTPKEFREGKISPPPLLESFCQTNNSMFSL